MHSTVVANPRSDRGERKPLIVTHQIQIQPELTAGHQDIALVKSVYEAFARADVPAILDLFAPECVIYQSSRVPWGGLFTGHAGVGVFLAKLTGTIRSKVTTERFIADEDNHVVAIGRTRGHVVATGREFDVPETHVWTLKSGKVVRFEAYIDTPLMRKALGL
jgi:hypothetical protein